jgi:hypothetical protein
VRLESLAVRLRPRTPAEAADLGMAMARAWWRPMWGAWLSVFVPVAIAVSAALREHPPLAALVLWWLKPLFERFALYVASHAVFGDTPSVRATLAAWRAALSPGLLYSLTFDRLNLARSFLVPVWQLERQTGRAARGRRSVLQRRLRGYAVWLTVVCAHFELIVLSSAGLLLELFMPAKADVGLDLWEAIVGGAGGEGGWVWSDTVLYFAAMSAIGPIYVAAGFSLYLNRRMLLEGWDIEVALRRLAERLAPAAAACAALALGLAVAFAPVPSHAQQPAPAAPASAIAEVLKAPEFATHRDVTGWKYIGESSERDSGSGLDYEFWSKVGKFLANAMQVAGWIAAAALVVLALWMARRLLPAAPGGAPEPPFAPAAAALAEVPRGERLPDDVAGAAAALAREGRLREALSLLYRGALAALARRGADLGAAVTEAECLREARATLEPPAFRYLLRLVLAWQSVAWGAQRPEGAAVAELCEQWRSHFAARGA